MINSENVKYFDRILSHILEVATQQIDFERMKELCNGDGDLALVIGQEFEKRGFASIAETKLEYSIVLRRNGLASVFYKNGGFAAEYERLNPPKTKAEKLNDHFYMIVNEKGYMPLEDYPKYGDYRDEELMNRTLMSYGLVKQKNDWVMPTDEGISLVYSDGTVQEHIQKRHSPQPSINIGHMSSSIIGNNNSHNIVDSSNHVITGNNNSVSQNTISFPSNVANTSTKYQGITESSKNKWWVSIIGAAITAAGTVVAKMLELF